MNKIAIVGLGYVGLPLAVEFAEKYPVWGYDIDAKRTHELLSGLDRTLEISSDRLKSSTLKITSNTHEIKDCNVFIITVPTPVDADKKPDLSILFKATETVGKHLKRDDLVIFESTVYPGCTEEDCVPILEKTSGLKFNQDFFCGYSPERINPGDKTKTIRDIVKVTSGSTPEIANKVNELYASIISAGTFQAKSIKVAEASKVVENTQRDLNIAFVNELAMMFDHIGIDTKEVLEAAGTKWNFMKVVPGLVGGQCIGVNPYYLSYKAEKHGFAPKLIPIVREINDGMARYVASRVIKQMFQSGHAVRGSKVLILGLTFKANCPDVRNSKVKDLVTEFREYECELEYFDPWVREEEAIKLLGFPIKRWNQTDLSDFAAVILAVRHQDHNFQEMQLGKKTVFYDLSTLR